MEGRKRGSGGVEKGKREREEEGEEETSKRRTKLINEVGGAGLTTLPTN